MSNDARKELTELKGIGPVKAEALRENGYTDVTDLRNEVASSLSDIHGFGTTLAEQILGNLDRNNLNLDSSELYLNRELSEIRFQKRVLNEALDERNPLLERVKFLAIFTNNMDEFFMKRIGGLKQQIAANVTDRTKDGRTPHEQWEEAIEMSVPLFQKQARLYEEVIRPALVDEDIEIVDYKDLEKSEKHSIDDYFQETIFPILTPLTFDPAHPFPHISNLSLSLAVLTNEGTGDEPRFSRVKIPPNFPRLVQVGNQTKYVPLEKIIAANLDQLFPDVEIKGHWLFRVTRNAEVRRNEEVAEDLIAMIEEVLRERKFATVVRLDVHSDTPDFIRDLLKDKLDLQEKEVFELDSLLDYRGLMELTELNRPGLKRDSWTPQEHPRFRNLRSLSDENRDPGKIFDEIEQEDILVHHPYHSFNKTIHRLLRDAAKDPKVLAIKAAIYRTATESKIIDSLIQAANNGKQVAVMVELKARFDEKNNLEWVDRLEDEGIHVAYGTIGYKTHTKTSLIVREKDNSDEVKLYSHVGTGNYHSETAKTYEDLGILTADDATGQDLTKLFNYFTGHSRPDDYEKLLVAPVNLREKLNKLIRREANHAQNGGSGRIIAKMNNLEDPEIVKELYEASRAGVEIDLIVRTICRLRPGISGVSENIRVHSIVGRFLEHSRIFYFNNNGNSEYYLGSADWMTRNLDNRVEAVIPVDNKRIRAKLDFIFKSALNDNRRRWVKKSNGTYEQIKPGDEQTLDIHRTLIRETRDATTPY